MHLWFPKIICYPVLRNVTIWKGVWWILHTGHFGFLTEARLGSGVPPDTKWASLSVQRQRDSKMPAITFNNWGTGGPKLAWYDSKMVDVRFPHIQWAVETDHKTLSSVEPSSAGIPTIELGGGVLN